MSAKLILTIAAVVLLGGGGVYIATNSGNEKQAAETDTEAQKTEQQERTEDAGAIEGLTGSVQDLFAQGENITCTFNSRDEAGVSEGVVYVAGDEHKMRGNFTHTASESGETYKGGMINDGTTIYTWSETPEGTFGMQMSAEGTNIGEAYETEEFSEQGFDPTTEVAYDCSSWRVDASMFVPPSDIEFMDYQAQMKAMQGAFEGSAGAGMDCSICENIPDESAQAQCLRSLQCE